MSNKYPFDEFWARDLNSFMNVFDTKFDPEAMSEFTIISGIPLFINNLIEKDVVMGIKKSPSFNENPKITIIKKGK